MVERREMVRFKRWIPLVGVLLALTPVLWLVGRVSAYRAMATPPPVERGPFTVDGVACGSSGSKVPRGVQGVRLEGGRVRSVSGRVLESNGRAVLRAGDVLGKVQQVLGPPDQEHRQGTVTIHGTWRWVRADLEIDYTGDVVERFRLGGR